MKATGDVQVGQRTWQYKSLPLKMKSQSEKKNEIAVFRSSIRPVFTGQRYKAGMTFSSGLSVLRVSQRAHWFPRTEKQRPAAFLEGGEVYHAGASPAAAQAGGWAAWEADCKDSLDIDFMGFLLIRDLLSHSFLCC